MSESSVSDRIEKRVEINAPVSRVWKAVTDHREFGEWFRVSVNEPFVVGKEASGNILHPGYEHIIWRAVIKEITPESLFSFTWHPYGIDKSIDYSRETPTLVEFKLSPTPKGGTLLVVTESGFDQIPAYRRAEAFLRNNEGWTQQVVNVQNYVASH